MTVPAPGSVLRKQGEDPCLGPLLGLHEAGQSVSRPSPSVVVSTQTRELRPGKSNPADTIKCRVENALPGLSTHRKQGQKRFGTKLNIVKGMLI